MSPKGGGGMEMSMNKKTIFGVVGVVVAVIAIAVLFRFYIPDCKALYQPPFYFNAMHVQPVTGA